MGELYIKGGFGMCNQQERLENFAFGLEIYCVDRNFTPLLDKMPISKVVYKGRMSEKCLSFTSFPFSLKAQLPFGYFSQQHKLFNLFNRLVRNHLDFDRNIRKHIENKEHEIALKKVLELQDLIDKKIDFRIGDICVSVLDLRWHFSFKVFLFVVAREIIGVQHGGAYDLYRINKVVEIEKNSCDRFLSWNTFTNTSKCFRYKKQIDLSLGRGLIVPHLQPKQELKKVTPGLYRHLGDNDTYDFLREFSVEKNMEFAEHPKFNNTGRFLPNIFKLSHTKVNYFSYFGSTLFEYAYIYKLETKLLLRKIPEESDLSSYGIEALDRLDFERRIELI